MSHATTERFDIGRVIGRTFGVIGRNFAVFAVLALLLNGLPTALFGLMQTGLLPSLGPLEWGLSWSWLLNMLISAWLQAAIIRGAISDLNGGKAVFGECLGTAAGDIFPLVGLSIVSTIAVVIGLFFFIIPGVFLALEFAVAAPARVMEKTGVIASLGRSANLTSGSRGAILGLYLLYGVLLVVGAIVLQAAAAPLSVLGGTGALINAGLVAPAAGAATSLVAAAGVAAIYFELRTVKEGIGIEALAAVFD